MRPDWDDLPAFARHEARRDAPNGWMLPRLLLFHDGQPTLYARGRTPHPQEVGTTTVHAVLRELAILAQWTRPSAAAVLVQARLRDRDVPGEGPSEGPGDEVVLVQSTDLGPDTAPRHTTTLLAVGRGDDGVPRFGPPQAQGGPGPFTELLEALLGCGGPLPTATEQLGPGGVAYALSRFGHVVAVASARRDDFGFDQPIAPSRVRPVDRDRARRHARRHRAGQRGATESSTTRGGA